MANSGAATSKELRSGRSDASETKEQGRRGQPDAGSGSVPVIGEDRGRRRSSASYDGPGLEAPNGKDKKKVAKKKRSRARLDTPDEKAGEDKGAITMAQLEAHILKHKPPASMSDQRGSTDRSDAGDSYVVQDIPRHEKKELAARLKDVNATPVTAAAAIGARVTSTGSIFAASSARALEDLSAHEQVTACLEVTLNSRLHAQRALEEKRRLKRLERAEQMQRKQEEAEHELHDGRKDEDEEDSSGSIDLQLVDQQLGVSAGALGASLGISEHTAAHNKLSRIGDDLLSSDKTEKPGREKKKKSRKLRHAHTEKLSEGRRRSVEKVTSSGSQAQQLFSPQHVPKDRGGRRGLVQSATTAQLHALELPGSQQPSTPVLAEGSTILPETSIGSVDETDEGVSAAPVPRAPKLWSWAEIVDSHDDQVDSVPPWARNKYWSDMLDAAHEGKPSAPRHADTTTVHSPTERSFRMMTVPSEGAIQELRESPHVYALLGIRLRVEARMLKGHRWNHILGPTGSFCALVELPNDPMLTFKTALKMMRFTSSLWKKKRHELTPQELQAWRYMRA